MRARALLGHISRAWTCGRISPEQTLCIILRHPGACTSRLPFHAGYAVIGRVRSMSSGSGQSASSAEGAGKWGAPGSKRMRKRAKDSFDGGPLKVTADDEAEWLAICEELKSKAKSLGLGPTAITTSDPSSRIKEFEKWIENGYHGDMGFLAREDRMARRRNLAEILPNVKAVIVTSLVYWPGEKGFPAEQSSETHGNVSCYAWGSDYHEILGNKLKELASWLHERAGGAGRWYVDTGAIMERDLGERAGIGFVGKNSLLIAPGLGSGFFLGEILTTLPLPIDAAKKSRAGCGKCTRCLDACPTDAFVGPYVLDARKCISYLTIEHKGHIPRQLRPAFGNRIYGCDVCQQVCPWNSSAYKGVSRKGSPLFGPVPVAVAAPELAELLALDEEAFAKRFSGSPISRIGLARLVRNAAVAAGNSRDPALLGAVVTALASWEGKDAMVSEHLEWARNRLAESR